MSNSDSSNSDISNSDNGNGGISNSDSSDGDSLTPRPPPQSDYVIFEQPLRPLTWFTLCCTENIYFKQRA